MKHTTQHETRFTDKRSFTETLLETLNETGLRPAFPESAGGRRARAGKLVAGLAVLLAVAAAGFVLLRWSDGPLPVAGDPVAVVEIVRGSAWHGPAGSGPAGSGPIEAVTAGSRSALTTGRPIYSGAVIETEPGRGRAALRLVDGQSLRLDAGTRVRLPIDGSTANSSLTLERGAVYIDSAARARVEVRTTLGVVRDVGTQFEVRLVPASDTEESLRVRVREGLVVLAQAGASHQAEAGVELSIDAGGNLTRAVTPTSGASWDWVLDAAPAPEIAGQPLSFFLDWVRREGGWAVEFADQETAERASTITLHGDIENLMPEEAMAMVLNSSGLGYSLAEGKLVVGPMAAP